MKKIIISVSLITSLLLMLGMTVPASASPEKVLVYTGDNGFKIGYTKFGEAVGRDIDTYDVFPEDLSAYICIILPANRENFSAETTSALVSFVNNGGKIIAQADAVDVDFDPTLLGAITNLNGLAGALGSNLYLEAAAIHTGYNITYNIDPSPFTDGILSIFYGWTSRVLVGPTAYSLVNAKGELTPKITIIGAEQIGEGWFILCGDLNIFSDLSYTGYTEQDNGVLAKNIIEYGFVLNEPPVADAGGPYMAVEGDTVTLDASGSYDPDGSIVLYEWDWDYDGVNFNPSGDTGVVQTHTWNDDSIYTIALRVTDDGGSTAVASLSIEVCNQPPEVNAGSDQTVDFGADVSVNAEYTDSGTLDTHTSTIDWGDGSSESGTLTEPGSIGTVTGNHSYAWPGTYVVTVEVTDIDGSAGSDTFTVVILPVPDEMVDNISDDIEEMELPASVENSLTTSLDTANKVLEDSNQNNDAAAINSLEAFINKLEAQRGKKIPADVADELIAKAQEIIDALTGSQ